MLTFTKGDILKISVEAKVNPVNCVGVCGKGLALRFRKAYPDNYEKYVDACLKRKIFPGKVFTTRTSYGFRTKYIINFPVKKHWKNRSRLEYIEEGLESMVEDVINHGVQSLAIPALGCGLGGLEWEDVKEIIEKKLSVLEDVDIFIFYPLRGVVL